MLDRLPSGILLAVAMHLPETERASNVIGCIYSRYPLPSAELLVFEEEYERTLGEKRLFVENGPLHGYAISSDGMSDVFHLTRAIRSLLLTNRTVYRTLSDNSWFVTYWKHIRYAVLSKREAIKAAENEEELERLLYEKNIREGLL